MIFLYVIVGSITTATRLKKQLETESAYSAEVVHTPAGLAKSSGCSYSVRTDNKAYSMLRPLSDASGIRIKKVYMEEIVGGERVFRAVP